MKGDCGQFANPSDLTVEQQTQMNKLKQDFLKDTADLRNEFQQKRLELRNLRIQAAPDKEAVAAKEKEFEEVRSKLREKCDAYRAETRKFLSTGPSGQTREYRFGPGMACLGNGVTPCRLGNGPGCFRTQ